MRGFSSGDPDYFISHVDLTRIAETAKEAAKLTGEASIALLFHHLSASRLVTIAQIEGRVRAAGSEFVLACDMRFAARESAIFAQFEPAFGLLPGGGAAQHLTRLMGRARALEVMLSADDYDADLAERYGWINRALPAAELDEFVQRACAAHCRVPGCGPRGSQGPRQRRHFASGRRLPARLGSVRRGRLATRRLRRASAPRWSAGSRPGPRRSTLLSSSADQHRSACLPPGLLVGEIRIAPMAGRSRLPPSLVTDATFSSRRPTFSAWSRAGPAALLQYSQGGHRPLAASHGARLDRPPPEPAGLPVTTRA